MGDQQRVAPIDGLRGIAALAVAWFHIYAQNGGTPLAEAMPHALNLASVRGRFGVQLFFAISGFVIAYKLPNDRSIWRPVDAGIYFIRRSVRLDPTYWFALACYLVGVPLIIALGGPYDVFPSQQFSLPEIIANIFSPSVWQPSLCSGRVVTDRRGPVLLPVCSAGAGSEQTRGCKLRPGTSLRMARLCPDHGDDAVSVRSARRGGRAPPPTITFSTSSAASCSPWLT